MLFPPKKPEVTLIKQLLNENGIAHNPDYLTRKLTGNPYYPSAKAIHETLRLYKIDNMIVKAPLPVLVKENAFPFISLLQIKREKRWVIIREVNNHTVRYYDVVDEKTNAIPSKQFEILWMGVSLLYSVTPQSSEPFFNVNKAAAKRNRIRNVLKYSAIALVVVSISNLFRNGSSLLILLFPCIIGLILCVMLWLKKHGKANRTLSKFCNFNKKTDCDAVIYSKASRLFGIFDLSELGLFYFSGISLLLVYQFIAGLKAPLMEIVWYTGAITVLFSFYLVTYQAFRVKKWCVFCLAVQGISWLLFGIVHSNHPPNSEPISFSDISMAILCFGLPMLLWELGLRKMLISHFEFDIINKKYQRLIKDHAVFDYLLSQSPKFMYPWKPSFAFTINSSKAPHTITCFLSPTCGPCKKLYHVLNRLFKGNDLFHIVIYIVSKGKKDNAVMEKILSSPRTVEVLDDWFMHSRTTAGKTMSEDISDYRQWLSKVDIAVTPQIYVNQRLLPIEHSLLDVYNRFV